MLLSMGLEALLQFIDLKIPPSGGSCALSMAVGFLYIRYSGIRVLQASWLGGVFRQRMKCVNG
jgi:hypothetical protein